ncbi:uncharacterized protein PHACADRAFT_33494 [Phanerochaete carnosa HHB-10118-sp]|uniref:Uncharacterized protein n=1 Tax=Phanerochaete carnosa (strain HHB-10118-sp) TaxID=650164 RepID=K5VE89_PHACS|nr:uncharacterized protein PHACADRAFT_33494 [Phanerochaete carnosa HHB-10118-sp]EKM49453.1 hypothetical protein PHACADRAFT_33494 [Phanerochaete carnosa HHB-10118-sp]
MSRVAVTQLDCHNASSALPETSNFRCAFDIPTTKKRGAPQSTPAEVMAKARWQQRQEAKVQYQHQSVDLSRSVNSWDAPHTFQRKQSYLTPEKKIGYTKDNMEKLTECQEDQRFGPHKTLRSIASTTARRRWRRLRHAFLISHSSHIALMANCPVVAGTSPVDGDTSNVDYMPDAKKSAAQDLLDMKTISNLILSALREYPLYRAAPSSLHWPLSVSRCSASLTSLFRPCHTAWAKSRRCTMLGTLTIPTSGGFSVTCSDVTRWRALLDPLEVPATAAAVGTSRIYETAFPVADAPERLTKNPRKDKGTQHGPNVRTKNWMAVQAGA